MKPLARWTLGPVTATGKKILRESVKLFAKAHPEFDRVVCYNHVEASELVDLSNLAELVEQSANAVPCDLSLPSNDPDEATGCGWKLSPPRLRLDAHELFLDNDLVIRERLLEIEAWLGGNSGIIAEGLHRRRMFGVFDKHIGAHIHACAGLAGFPPGFDIQEQIVNYSPFLCGKSFGGYDEQGMTTAMITNMAHYILVPLTTCHIAEDHQIFPDKMPRAVHFTGANRKEWHRGWSAYLSWPLRKIRM
jgi:hypothetical protein